MASLMQSSAPRNRRLTSRDGVARERLTGKILASDFISVLDTEKTGTVGFGTPWSV